MYFALKERSVISNLSSMGHIFIGPCVGKLREGEIGIGRMVEPIEISKIVQKILSPSKKKKILISSGASKIYIDPVRYITNGATGSFASFISNELRMLGHDVEVLNISSHSNKDVVEIVKNKNIDVYISTAAFSDFDVVKFSLQKIKKESINKIDLKTNVDVLKSVSSLRFDVYGFKLDDEKENAVKKMKNLNLKGIL
jgi:phosphopantothenoylcysteine decarboxylase/phosphopantothenate--cysteine ligase